MKRLFQTGLLVIALPVSFAISRAQAHDGKFCQVALESSDATIRKLAERMARASELTDLSLKSRAIHKVTEEIRKHEKYLGSSVWQRIGDLVAQQQRKLSGNRAVEEQARTESVGTDTDLIMKWTKFESFPLASHSNKVLLAPKTNRLIFFEPSFEPSKIGVLDLTHPNSSMIYIPLKGMNFRFSPTQWTLSDDEQSLLTSNHVLSLDEMTPHDRVPVGIELGSGELINFKVPHQGAAHIGFGSFPDRSIVSVFADQVYFQAPNGEPNLIANLNTWHQALEIKATPDGLYAFIKSHGRIFGIFDRQRMRLLNIQDQLSKLLKIDSRRSYVTDLQYEASAKVAFARQIESGDTFLIKFDLENESVTKTPLPIDRTRKYHFVKKGDGQFLALQNYGAPKPKDTYLRRLMGWLRPAQSKAAVRLDQVTLIDATNGTQIELPPSWKTENVHLEAKQGSGSLYLFRIGDLLAPNYQLFDASNGTVTELPALSEYFQSQDGKTIHSPSFLEIAPDGRSILFKDPSKKLLLRLK